MSKSETWWCVKDRGGKYHFWTMTKIKREAMDFRFAIGGKVVCLRVEEVKANP